MFRTVTPLILFFYTLTTFAQQPNPNCDPEKSHQFDFWIGHWKVSSNGSHAGINRIVPILNGCVLQENWEGASGNSGTSLNYYNPVEKRWEQFWVWRNGKTMHLKGDFKDGKMTLLGELESPKGKAQHRITWTPNPDGTVRQLWESRQDGAEEWQPLFDGLYTKIGGP